MKSLRIDRQRSIGILGEDLINQIDRQIVIRRALDNDADFILRTHYEAVHVTASQVYNQDILDEWAPAFTPERIIDHRDRIKQGNEESIFLVAERDGKIIGFGMFEPSTDELSAVYVAPAVGRQGVGTKILHELERAAGGSGVRKIWLKASLNAEQFYLRHHFIREGLGEHRFNSGLKMPCVLMHKYL